MDLTDEMRPLVERTTGYLSGAQMSIIIIFFLSNRKLLRVGKWPKSTLRLYTLRITHVGEFIERYIGIWPHFAYTHQ